MITTSIRPTSQHVQLDVEVPAEYVGQEVTVTLFVEQKKTGAQEANNAAQYKGIFTADEGEQFQNYLREARSGWDRSI